MKILIKKYILLAFFLVFISGFVNIAYAQISRPVHWSYAFKKVGAHTAVVFIKATIDDGWHIYSLNQKDGGPLKTSFEFAHAKSYKLDGNTVEPTPINKYERVFSMDVNYFEKSVTFQQKVMLTSIDAVVRGKVNFMTCNNQKCLPLDEVEFSYPNKII